MNKIETDGWSVKQIKLERQIHIIFILYLLGNPNKYVYTNGRFIVFVICCITCFVYCYKIIFCFPHQQITTVHASSPKFIQWWPNVGPPSMTLTRYWLGAHLAVAVEGNLRVALLHSSGFPLIDKEGISGESLFVWVIPSPWITSAPRDSDETHIDYNPLSAADLLI